MSTQNQNVDFKFDNTYARDLEGFFTLYKGDRARAPSLIKFNEPLAQALGFDLTKLSTEDIAVIFSGGADLKGAEPLAQVYAGHQFGGFSPRLGDGRALLLGEIIDLEGKRHDIHLKGSGRTTYSRGGDGKAALGSVLREYLLGEAMHALGVPTTRALAAVLTGEDVYRDKLLPGAVLARTASSHIRVGTFQYFAAQGDYKKVQQLADYTIARHFPTLKSKNQPYLELLRCIGDRQAQLIAKWMQIGFVHGVMNTDNMTVSGETIDYGPCAFIDDYVANAVFSSIDHQGRYSYENQMPMAQWNLARLAETLLPLIDENADKSVELATHEIKDFSVIYERYWLDGMCKKIGLFKPIDTDLNLVSQLLELMQLEKVDFTQFFRQLTNVVQENDEAFKDIKAKFNFSEAFDHWLVQWQQRVNQESFSADERAKLMGAVNPVYIPRNHLVEAALEAAEKDNNFEVFEKLLLVLSKPFDEIPKFEAYSKPAPASFGSYTTFCGT